MNGMGVLLVLVGYFGLLMLVSWLTARKGGNNDTFFRGNRQSPWFVVAFGMIGASMSGVSFVSVPGWVERIDMTYLQMVMGFLVGYVVVAFGLLPLYYRMGLASVYGYLGNRFGVVSRRTGSAFFLLARMTGTAAKSFLVCSVLQAYVFDAWGVPFPLTVCFMMGLIWLYTRHGGVRTIVWTDSLQTLCLLAAICLIVFQIGSKMGLDVADIVRTVADNPHSRIFEFADVRSSQYFWKQFVSGVFIVIVMTGLDQDMMQKNLSCRSLRDAQKNMCSYGAAFLPVNLLLLSLGVLLLAFASSHGLPVPDKGDELLPSLCGSGVLGVPVLVLFTVGIVAATFANADSALTAMTTSICVDILGMKTAYTSLSEQEKAVKMRKWTHWGVTLLFILFILLFRVCSYTSLIDAVFTLASYTYGPLLGLFALGLFTRCRPRERWTPVVCVLAPLLCYLFEQIVQSSTGYRFGYEILLLNGSLVFVGLWTASLHIHSQRQQSYGNYRR